MIIEIPDPEVIVSVIVAFLVGIFGFYVYYKLKPYVNLKPKSVDSSYLERLEYYERQLIDMKIRLDALEIQGVEEKPAVFRLLRHFQMSGSLYSTLYLLRILRNSS